MRRAPARPGRHRHPARERQERRLRRPCVAQRLRVVRERALLGIVKRARCAERPDRRRHFDQLGFRFHGLDGCGRAQCPRDLAPALDQLLVPHYFI
jgi:hypothetical protein